MSTQPQALSDHPLRVNRIAAFPGMRALAWHGDLLYASRGYKLLRAKVNGDPPKWETVGSHRPEWWRNLSSAFRLTFRLFRDGFHALAILSAGQLVAAVPGAILTLPAGNSEFAVSHRVLRGTRPLHITSTPNGQVFWGEYFDNPGRDEVHIYASSDYGASWNVAYTFPKGAVRHVHNIVYDEWQDCLWILTGDNGEECRILRASCDFRSIDVAMSGNQQARAVALITTRNGLYFSSDTPLETNHIYQLDRRGNLEKLSMLNGSSIYGCRVGEAIFFSTMIEPSDVNLDRYARLYGSRDGHHWHNPLMWKKDLWPMGLFQFGNVLLPDGPNTSGILALTTVAVKNADLETSLWKLDSIPSSSAR